MKNTSRKAREKLLRIIDLAVQKVSKDPFFTVKPNSIKEIVHESEQLSNLISSIKTKARKEKKNEL